MMSRPVRVLHVRDSPWVDGPGRTILETAKQIDRRRVDYQVGIFVSDPATPHPLVEALRFHGLPVHVIRDRGGVNGEMVTRLVELMDGLQTDVLHTSEFRSNVLGLLCRRRRAVRLVSTAHGWIANGLKGKLYTLIDRVLLRHFDEVILVSQAMRKRLPGWWVPDLRIRVVHNALAVDSYGASTLRDRRRGFAEDGHTRLLVVGRLSPEKGHSYLLRAIASLAPTHPEVHLWIAGVGPLEEDLRRLADRLGISRQVRFLGYVDKMPELYSKVDAVVQSSLTEGLPNVLLEAAFLGLPIVATDVGGTSEVVQDGRTGRLVRPGSHRALEDGLRELLAAPTRFVDMAAGGKATVESNFSMPARTEAQSRIYEALS